MKLTATLHLTDENWGESMRLPLADPMFMLTRMQQLGHLKGVSAGDPVLMRVRYKVLELTHYAVSKDTTNSYDWQELEPGVPLSAQTLGFPMPPSLAQREEAGLLLLELLARKGGSEALGTALTEHWGLEGARFAAALPDAFALLADEAELDGAVAAINSTLDLGGLHEALEGVAQWLKRNGIRRDSPEWPYESSIDESSSAESPGSNSSDFAFNIEQRAHRLWVKAETADGALILEAPDFMGRTLKWSDFSLIAEDPGVSTNTDIWQSADTHTRFLLPSQISFKGAPSSVLWELEDNSVHLASYAVREVELARRVITEFVLRSKDDWFRIPLRVDANSLLRVVDIEVHDAFGVVSRPMDVMTIPGDHWRLGLSDRTQEEEAGVNAGPAPTTVLMLDDTPSVWSDSAEWVQLQPYQGSPEFIRQSEIFAIDGSGRSVPAEEKRKARVQARVDDLTKIIDSVGEVLDRLGPELAFQGTFGREQVGTFNKALNEFLYLKGDVRNLRFPLWMVSITPRYQSMLHSAEEVARFDYLDRDRAKPLRARDPFGDGTTPVELRTTLARALVSRDLSRLVAPEGEAWKLGPGRAFSSSGKMYVWNQIRRGMLQTDNPPMDWFDLLSQ